MSTIICYLLKTYRKLFGLKSSMTPFIFSFMERYLKITRVDAIRLLGIERLFFIHRMMSCAYENKTNESKNHV